MSLRLAAVTVLAAVGAVAAGSAVRAESPDPCGRSFEGVRVSEKRARVIVRYRRAATGRVSVELLRGRRVVARARGSAGRAVLRPPRRLRNGRYTLRLRLGSRPAERLRVVRRGRHHRVTPPRRRPCAPPPLPSAADPGAPPAPAAAAPPRTPDPGAPGGYAVEVFDYDAGPVVLTDQAGTPSASPQRLQGAIYVTSAPGPRPLVVLQHGKHQTCKVAGAVDLLVGHPCADTPATADIRSYRGYEYLARSLASNGYVVASVDANGINSYDYPDLEGGHLQRAQLIAKTLDLLAAWHAQPGPEPVGDRLVGRVDLSRIGLMGHSRGGEGVTAFIDYNRERSDGPQYPGLRAVLALAPTDFNDLTPHGVVYGTLLPLCDGDVRNLDGAQAYDRGRFAGEAARVQYTVTGANHNYFNSVWVNDMWADDHEVRGDPDSACSPDRPTSVRLTPAEQQAVGLVVMAGFMRRHVGGEGDFDGVARGAAPLPPSACLTSKIQCAALVGTSSLAPPSDRLVLLAPGEGDAATATARGVQMSECTPNLDGSGCPTVPTRALAKQLTVRWSGEGTLRAELPAGGLDASRFRALTFRAGVNYGEAASDADFDVVLEDAAGATRSVRASAFTNALRVPPGDATRELTLNGAWIPLEAFAGVDLRRVRAVELRFGGTGSVQLAELLFQR